MNFPAKTNQNLRPESKIGATADFLMMYYFVISRKLFWLHKQQFLTLPIPAFFSKLLLKPHGAIFQVVCFYECPETNSTVIKP